MAGRLLAVASIVLLVTPVASAFSCGGALALDPDGSAPNPCVSGFDAGTGKAVVQAAPAALQSCLEGGALPPELMTEACLSCLSSRESCCHPLASCGPVEGCFELVHCITGCGANGGDLSCCDGTCMTGRGDAVIGSARDVLFCGCFEGPNPPCL